MLALVVVIAHWIVAVLHLFLAVKVLPIPNNNVSWLAITLITLGHFGVSIVLWKLSDKLTGSVSLVFFLAALGADLDEHFFHASANNVFMVAPGDWTAQFDVSVFSLLALEILGCLLGILLLGRRTGSWRRPRQAGQIHRSKTNGSLVVMSDPVFSESTLSEASILLSSRN